MTPDPENLKFEKLDKSVLQQLIRWAASEGWNPGPYDANVFWQTDPDGYYGYYHQGELIAGGSVVSYGGSFGFMGFFIVKPELRSKGIGRRLWMQRRDLLIARLKPGAPIGMDGVVDMQPFYNRGGFQLAFRDERYARKGEKFAPDPHISLIEPGDFNEVSEYDTACFGFPRPQFLKPWLAMPLSRALKYVDNGRLKGFALMRRVGEGYKIGPLFADDAHIAGSLYTACLSAVPGEMVYLDIPVINDAAVKLVKKYHAHYTFECARMYYGPPPEMPLHRIFGITTFELG
ncbi:MAG: GNAT family N-acetyltransferase [Bacteroidota bacterium]